MTTPISAETATRASLIQALYNHAQVTTTRELKSWVIATYLDDTIETPGGLPGWAHDLKHRNKGFRKRDHVAELFQLLNLETTTLEGRKSRPQASGKRKPTWASVVRSTVHWIADNATAAKAAVDQLPDEQLKFTSLKSFTSFSNHLKLQVDTHSDDPTATLSAELCMMAGVSNPTDLKSWIKSNFIGEGAETIDTWDFTDHPTLIQVQRVIRDIQQAGVS